MKKALFFCMLGALAVATSAHAEGSKMAVGAGYGLGNGGVLSLHGDYDISDMVGQPSVKARVGWDHYSIDSSFIFSSYTWTYNVFYAGAYKDFSKEFSLGDKIHPFAGLGFGVGTTSLTCSGAFCATIPKVSAGGFYYIGGVQYDVTKTIQAEASFSGWTGISLGANYKF